MGIAESIGRHIGPTGIVYILVAFIIGTSFLILGTTSDDFAALLFTLISLVFLSVILGVFIVFLYGYDDIYKNFSSWLLANPDQPVIKVWHDFPYISVKKMTPADASRVDGKRIKSS